MRNPLLNGVTGNKTLLFPVGKTESEAENLTDTPSETGVAFGFSKMIVFLTCEAVPKSRADCGCTKPALQSSNSNTIDVAIDNFFFMLVSLVFRE